MAQQNDSQQTTALAPRKQFQQDLKAIVASAAAVMPKHMTPDRLFKLVYAAASKPPARPDSPTLFDCTPASIGMCLTTCAEIGLEPGDVRGHVYLLPRRNSRANNVECTLQIGYKGYAELARRAGVQTDGTIVYVGEPFMVSRAGRPSIREIIAFAGEEILQYPKLLEDFTQPGIWHTWRDDIDRSDKNLRAAYAVAFLDDGKKVFEVLTRQEIDARRSRSQSRDNGPWVTDYARMARKSALRALFTGGLVPMSAELEQALEIDHDDDVIDVAVRTSAASSLKQLAQQSVERAGADDDTQETLDPNPLTGLADELAQKTTVDDVMALQADWIGRHDVSLKGDIKSLCSDRLKALTQG